MAAPPPAPFLVPVPPFPGGNSGLYGLLQLASDPLGQQLINRLMLHQINSEAIQTHNGISFRVPPLLGPPVVDSTVIWAAGIIPTCQIPANPNNEPSVNLTAGMLTGWINNAANPLGGGIIALLNASSWAQRANGLRTVGVHVLGAVHYLMHQGPLGIAEITRLLFVGFHLAVNPERDVSHLWQGPRDIVGTNGPRRTIRACIESHAANIDRISCRVFNRTLETMHTNGTVLQLQGGCICGARFNINPFRPRCDVDPATVRVTILGVPM